MNHNLKEAFALMEKNFSEEQIYNAGPKDQKLINSLEIILKIKFPVSYKEFIEKIGMGGPDSLLISGIRTNMEQELASTGLGWSVLNDRENFNIPNHIIILDEIGDGSSYALDLSQMNAENECPVVIWPLNGYEDTPVLEVVAKDFGEFFLNMVKEEIAMKAS